MKCYYCKSVFSNVEDAINHLKQEYLIPEKEEGFSLSCFFKVDSGCDETFTTYSSLRRHLQKRHGVNSSKRSFDKVDLDEVQPSVSKKSLMEVASQPQLLPPPTLEKATEALFAQMEAAGISEAQQTAVATNLKAIIQAFGTTLSNNVQKNPKKSVEIVNCVTEQALQQVEIYQSNYLRQKNYFNNEYYVHPTEKAIALRNIKSFNKDLGVQAEKVVQTSFQFVSPTALLKTLLKMAEFRQYWFNPSHVCTPGVYVDVCCGENCQQSLFHQENPLAGRAELYYDESEPCDGLKVQRGVHKLGFFYLKWRNIDPILQSRLSNIHLVAIANYEDIKGGKSIVYLFNYKQL